MVDLELPILCTFVENRPTWYIQTIVSIVINQCIFIIYYCVVGTPTPPDCFHVWIVSLHSHKCIIVIIVALVDWNISGCSYILEYCFWDFRVQAEIIKIHPDHVSSSAINYNSGVNYSLWNKNFNILKKNIYIYIYIRLHLWMSSTGFGFIMLN